MQETCSTDCMSCEYGKQLQKRCLEECESAIDAAYDFHELTTICKNQHIKNKEGKETMKEDAPTATLQEKNDAIIQTINQIMANVKNAAMKEPTPRFGGYVKYENPIEHTRDIEIGQVFISEDGERPQDLCESAWESMAYFVRTLAAGGGNFYDGWMKNPRSAMISCNDGFRPVSFLIEVIEE